MRVQKKHTSFFNLFKNNKMFLIPLRPQFTKFFQICITRQFKHFYSGCLVLSTIYKCGSILHVTLQNNNVKNYD